MPDLKFKRRYRHLDVEFEKLREIDNCSDGAKTECYNAVQDIEAATWAFSTRRPRRRKESRRVPMPRT